MGIIGVLQGCCRGVTGVLLRCYGGVTGVLHICLRGVLQWYFRVVTQVLLGC